MNEVYEDTINYLKYYGEKNHSKIENIACFLDCELKNYIKLQSNWNSLREENKALRLLLNWAVECDWGFDNFSNDDVINWEEFEEESEDMDYIESMIFYAKKYLDKMNELEGKEV